MDSDEDCSDGEKQLHDEVRNCALLILVDELFVRIYTGNLVVCANLVIFIFIFMC